MGECPTSRAARPCRTEGQTTAKRSANSVLAELLLFVRGGFLELGFAALQRQQLGAACLGLCHEHAVLLFQLMVDGGMCQLRPTGGEEEATAGGAMVFAPG